MRLLAFLLLATLLAPRFHCIVPNQFGNTMRVLETLQRQGHHRICAVFDELFDERTAHNFTAAVNWKPGRSTLFVPQAASNSDRAELVAGWIATQRPDAVFAQSDA